MNDLLDDDGIGMDTSIKAFIIKEYTVFSVIFSIIALSLCVLTIIFFKKHNIFLVMATSFIFIVNIVDFVSSYRSWVKKYTKNDI